MFSLSTLHCTHVSSSHVVNMLNPTDKNGYPTLKILPEGGSGQLQTVQAEPPLLITMAVMLDNMPCPVLDQTKSYWVSFNGAHAEVFDNMSVFSKHFFIVY